MTGPEVVRRKPTVNYHPMECASIISSLERRPGNAFLFVSGQKTLNEVIASLRMASPCHRPEEIRTLGPPGFGFFIKDALSGRKFLVDTGTFRSLLPVTAVERIHYRGLHQTLGSLLPTEQTFLSTEPARSLSKLPVGGFPGSSSWPTSKFPSSGQIFSAITNYLSTSPTIDCWIWLPSIPHLLALIGTVQGFASSARVPSLTSSARTFLMFSDLNFVRIQASRRIMALSIISKQLTLRGIPSSGACPPRNCKQRSRLLVTWSGWVFAKKLEVRGRLPCTSYGKLMGQGDPVATTGGCALSPNPIIILYLTWQTSPATFMVRRFFPSLTS